MEELDFEEGTENKTKENTRETTQEIKDILSGKKKPTFHFVDFSSEEKRKELRELKKEYDKSSKKATIDRQKLDNFRITR